MKRGSIISAVWIIFGVPVILAAQGRYLERMDESFRASENRPLEVYMEVDAGEVTVERGSDFLEGHVWMRFTEGQYRAKIDFDERLNRLKLVLSKKNWFSWRGSGRRGIDEEATIELRLPHGVDILFDSDIKAGEVTMEMGGLRLREFYLHNWAGEIEVRFGSPNPIKMDFLGIRSSVGELRLDVLGNARFSKADINAGIGEIDIDFSGDLLDGSSAKVDLDIGEGSIYLPDDVGVKMSIGGGWSFLSQKNLDRSFTRRGDTYYSDDYDEAARKFSVRITPGLGELNVDR